MSRDRVARSLNQSARRTAMGVMLAIAALSLLSARPANATSRRPNILFVLVDDLGFADFSVTGNRTVPTPNIDRLAAEGLLMTQFYVASPICSPSRAGFMTGKFPARLGFVSFISSRAHNREMDQADWLEPRVPTIPSLLRRTGYATGHFGKWHLGGGRDIGEAPHPSAYGFDDSYVQFEGLGPRLLITEDHYGLASQSAKLGHGPIDHAPKSHTTAAYIDRALGFIDRHSARPWYVQLWLDDVHDPWEPDAGQLAAVKGLGRTPDENRFSAVLAAMDVQIGRLVRELDRRGELSSTLIILTGDNGPTAAEGYYRGGSSPPGSTGPYHGRKASLYEGGIRQPLIVRWPGVIAPRHRDHTTIASAVDFLPTLLAVAGTRPPSDIDGVSLVSAWRNRPISFRPPLYWAYGGFGLAGKSPLPWLERDRSPHYAIRSGRWKLLADADGKRLELFDMQRDQGERVNVAGRNHRLVASLSASLTRWRKALPVRDRSESPTPSRR